MNLIINHNVEFAAWGFIFCKEQRRKLLPDSDINILSGGVAVLFFPLLMEKVFSCRQYNQK